MAEGTRLAQPGEETSKEVTDCCHQLPRRDYWKGRWRLFSEMRSRGIKDDSHELQQDKVWLNKKKLFIKVRAIQLLSRGGHQISLCGDGQTSPGENPKSPAGTSPSCSVEREARPVDPLEMPSNLKYATVYYFALDIILKLQHTLKCLKVLTTCLQIVLFRYLAVLWHARRDMPRNTECKNRGYHSS